MESWTFDSPNLWPRQSPQRTVTDLRCQHGNNRDKQLIVDSISAKRTLQ